MSPKARNTDPDAGQAQANGSLQLRVSYVWRDEVMADKLLPPDQKVTLGKSKNATITIADIGLPDEFAILRPGARGYVLTLGKDMAGRVIVGGQDMDVVDLLRSEAGQRVEGETGAFRATSISSDDGGIIDLDGRGEHILAFHFVPANPPLPTAKLWESELLLPALAFALILHTALVAMTFVLDEPGHSMVFPGRTDLMTSYLVARPEPPPPDKGPAESSASKDGEKKNVKSATQGKKGKAGGEGKKPRQRDPNPSDEPPAPEVGLLTEDSRASIRKITENRAMDNRLAKSLSRLRGNPLLAAGPGSGTGTGTGFGPGRDGTGTTRGGKGGGPGGGGSVQGDVISQGKVDVGESRAPKGTGGDGRGTKEVAVVGTGDASGDFGGLSKAEIDKVVRSRQGLIRACYQRELQRTRGLGGKLVVNFRIAADGSVKSARVVGAQSSLRNSSVESCVTRQITNLKFPAKGGGVVNYPFIFSQG